jgi:hypothetical protein
MLSLREVRSQTSEVRESAKTLNRKCGSAGDSLPLAAQTGTKCRADGVAKAEVPLRSLRSLRESL